MLDASNEYTGISIFSPVSLFNHEIGSNISGSRHSSSRTTSKSERSKTVPMVSFAKSLSKFFALFRYDSTVPLSCNTAITLALRLSGSIVDFDDHATISIEPLEVTEILAYESP